MTVDKGGKAVREEEWGKRWKGLKLWTGKREKWKVKKIIPIMPGCYRILFK